jgi:glutathione S-transferase
VRHISRFRSVDPAVMAHFHALAETGLTFIDTTLQGQKWLVGEGCCSIANIRCWGRMVVHSRRRPQHRPLVKPGGVANRLKALPSFALPYDLIPKKDA